jgi:hypothetical protein
MVLPGTSTFNHSGLLHTLADFSGDDAMNVSDWTRSVRTAALLAGWSDGVAMNVVRLKLKNQAMLFEKFDRDAQAAQTLDELLRVLEKRFGSDQISGSILQELTSIQQGRYESCREYAQRTRVLAARLSPDSASLELFSKIAHFYYINGLRAEIRRPVLSALPKDLDSAVNISCSEETNLKYFGLESASDEPYSELSKRVAALELKPERAENFGIRKDVSQSPKETRRCYGCSKVGHLIRFCPDRSRHVRFESPQSRSRQRERNFSRDRYRDRDQFGRDRSASPFRRDYRRRSSPYRPRTPSPKGPWYELDSHRKSSRSAERGRSQSRSPKRENSPGQWRRSSRSASRERRYQGNERSSR